MHRLEGTLVALAAVALCNCSSGDASTESHGDAGVDSAGGDSSGTLDARTDTSSSDTGAVDTGSDAGLDTGFDAGSEASACSEGTACSTNVGAPCKAGKVSCSGGVATCVDGAATADGTTCTGGACTRGKCLAPLTVSANVDLSTTSLTPGRTCASESPAFSVIALDASKATVSSAPTGDCLAVGDEVLLINLQGSSTATTNVGNWELLEVKGVSGADVTFAVAKTKFYGAVAGADAAVGIGATDQKVALVRVPQFGALTVASGISVTSGRWSGTSGGVLALRAAALSVDGTLTASGLGYRSGRWSRDGACSGNVATEAGESIDGPSVVDTANHFGGAGGVSALTGVSFNGDTPMCAGAGHAGAGEAGKNPKGRTLGSPGVAYGVDDAAKLTMGSGGSGNLTCETAFGAPALVDGGELLAGGIVMLLTDHLDIGATGKVTASANTASRDVSASGGYVFISGSVLNVGPGRVTAIGGTGTSLDGPFRGQTVKSGDGYIVVKATTVTGTTSPIAKKL